MGMLKAMELLKDQKAKKRTYRGSQWRDAFLDEIGKASTRLRNSLLRVLDNKEVKRIGSNKQETVDISLIVAANENLNNLLEFCPRLGFKMSLPPLRNRPDDLPVLIAHFVDLYYRKNPSLITKLPVFIDPKTLSKLMSYEWPSNVRELKNVIEKALLLLKKKSK